jgi:DNA-binding NarL/FixJ family response regulator
MLSPLSNAEKADEPIRVVLVDGHAIFRNGLAGMLESASDVQVVGHASDPEQAVEYATRADPDVVLIGEGSHVGSGVKAIGELAARSRASILILSPCERLENAERALLAGASGYLLKRSTGEEIVAAIRAAADGGSPLSPEIASGMVERFRGEHAQEETELPSRKLAVLKLLAEGRSNAEIAAELRVSIETVKNHVSSLLERLGAKNRTQAAVEAVRRHLI